MIALEVSDGVHVFAGLNESITIGKQHIPITNRQGSNAISHAIRFCTEGLMSGHVDIRLLKKDFVPLYIT